MNRIKRLFAMAAVVALGLMIHANAFAQMEFGTTWTVTSNTRTARSTSLADAVGSVVLTATSAGTITGGGTNPSQIVLDYGVRIVR